MTLASTPEIIAELKAGRMVILVDEEDRENEGDLVIAAEFVTPEAINFMARYGRGLICLTLTQERCELLNLPLMTHAQRHAVRHRVHVSASRRPKASPPAFRRPTAPAPIAGRRRARTRRPSTSCSRATSSRSWRSPAACWCAPAIPRRAAT